MNSHIRSVDGALLQFTTDIVAAYLQNNKLEVSGIPELLETVHNKVCEIYQLDDPKPVPPVPAVAIEDSVTPDHIICLEDGKKFKMLKKHLRSHYDMSPEEYRSKWNLPVDYPMVAPNYAEKRQELARASGLGKSR